MKSVDLMKNRTFIVICMLWFTVLALWTTSRISSIIKQSVPRSIAPVGTVGVTGTIDVGNDQFAVPMGNNTVWIIDKSLGSVTVVTHDGTGYHYQRDSLSPKG